MFYLNSNNVSKKSKATNLLIIMLFFISCSKEDEAVYKPYETSEKYVDVWHNPKLKPLNGDILLNPLASDLLVLNRDASKIQKKIIKDSSDRGFYLFKFSSGNNFYTFMKTIPDREMFPFFNATGMGASFSTNLYILDKNFETIKTIPYILSSKSFKLQNFPLEVHDYIIIDENHYIVFTYYPAEEKITGNKVVGIFIQEVKDSDIVWEWDSINFPDIRTRLGLNIASKFRAMSMFGDYEDYLHLNSIFIDPKDNNLILSIRASSSVIKIRRKPSDIADGEIIWILGGYNDEFGLSDDDKFMFQHHATLLDDNETLLLFDNGSFNDRPYSRIAEYKLNEVAKTVTEKKITTVKSPVTGNNYFGMYQGSVQKIDNRYFINYSGTHTNRSFIVEYDRPTDEVVLEIDTKKSSAGSYRAYKVR